MCSDLSDRQKKILEYYKDTMLHKIYVIESSLILSNYLFSINKISLGLSLLERANIHDNSKLCGSELENMASIYGNTDSFTNPESYLSDSEFNIIKEHWSNNRHHPEYYSNYEDMTELDILEMVCDWHARSKQYDTDFLEFVRTRQETRFHFNSNMFKKIYEYCKIIIAN